MFFLRTKSKTTSTFLNLRKKTWATLMRLGIDSPLRQNKLLKEKNLRVPAVHMYRSFSSIFSLESEELLVNWDKKHQGRSQPLNWQKARVFGDFVV